MRMRQSVDEDSSWGESRMQDGVRFSAYHGILQFGLLFAVGIWLLFTDWAWLGAVLLAMILGAWGIVLALRRKSARNPHRHARAKARNAQSSPR